MPESDLIADILIAFGSSPRIRLWRQNTGVATSRTGAFVRFGIPGQADISGIGPGGRRIEIECKSLTGRQTDAQRKWGEMITRLGGIYVLARSVGDVREVLS